jgi:hypothetical protein
MTGLYLLSQTPIEAQHAVLDKRESFKVTIDLAEIQIDRKPDFWNYGKDQQSVPLTER